MKRLLSLITALILLFTCTASLSEENTDNRATITITHKDGTEDKTVLSEDATNSIVTVFKAIGDAFREVVSTLVKTLIDYELSGNPLSQENIDSFVSTNDTYSLPNGNVLITEYYLFHKRDNGLFSRTVDGQKVCGIQALGIHDPIGGDYTLESITIPAFITQIEGGNPFSRFNALKSIQVAANHPTLESIDGVLFDKTNHRLICYPAAKKSSSYSVPNGTKAIGPAAFSFNPYITNVTLPAGLERIENAAFAHCQALKSIALPASLVSIESAAFKETGLVQINLPRNVSCVASGAFLNCLSLSAFIVSPNNPVYDVIDGVLFNKQTKALVCYPAGKKAASYAIPQGIAVIAPGSFAYNEALTSVSIPDSVHTVDIFAFMDCGSLESIALPSSVKALGNGAFLNCSSLKQLTIPASVTNVGHFFFPVLSNFSNAPFSASDANYPPCTVLVERGSAAADYCEEIGLNYRYPDSLDWLNN